MRNDPEKFSSLIYFDTAAYYNRKQAYTDMLLEEAEKLYANMVKELVDESISEHAFNTTISLSSLTPTDKEPQCLSENNSDLTDPPMSSRFASV